jgi:hypothetical protein
MADKTEIKALSELKIPDLGAISASIEAEKKPEESSVIETSTTESKPTTPVAEVDDTVSSEIPTDIFGSDPKPKKEKKKTDAEYAEERRQAKIKKAEQELGVDQLRVQLEEQKSTLLNLETERERIQRERTEYEEKWKVAESRLKEKETALSEREKTYYDDFKPQVDPSSDDELRKHQSGMLNAFTQLMPDRIQTANGQERFLADTFFKSPEKEAHVDQVMGYFAQALNDGNHSLMDTAVNAMAQLMGADVVLSNDPMERRLLEKNDPTFLSIERAMKAARGPFIEKANRKQYLQAEAPKIVQEQLSGREEIIRQGLRKSVLLSPEDRSTVLRSNPVDSAGIVSALVEANPHLTELIEHEVHRMAPAFARMGKIQVPMVDNSKEGMDRHRNETVQYQKTIKDSMNAAILGKAAGPIIAALMGQVTALQSRVKRESELTNPGGGSVGKEGEAAAPTIDTAI